ncbi:hypothetical protein AB0F07_16845 [Streptomyces fructofermentans]
MVCGACGTALVSSLTGTTTRDGERWTYLYDSVGRRVAKRRLDDGGSRRRRDPLLLGRYEAHRAGHPRRPGHVVGPPPGRSPAGGPARPARRRPGRALPRHRHRPVGRSVRAGLRRR